MIRGGHAGPHSFKEIRALLFGKRKKPVGVQAQLAQGQVPTDTRQSDVFRIEFDMMLKGSVYRRRGGDVRQFGVTVRGATFLVTSGDLVDRTTLEALLAVGAIRPLAPRQKPDGPPAENAPPAAAPKIPATQTNPAEAPRRPSFLEPKPQEPPPLRIVPGAAIPDAAPESGTQAQDAPKEAAPAPAEASAENPSPNHPPDDPAPEADSSSKQGPGPQGRSAKNRRRRGSR